MTESTYEVKIKADTTDLEKSLSVAKELEESLQHSSNLLDKLTSNNQSIQLNIDGKKFAEAIAPSLQKLEAKNTTLKGFY